MRKGDATASIFRRGLAARPASSLSQCAGGITVYFHVDFSSVDSEQMLTVTDYDHSYTAEQLCYRAAAQLRLSPMTAPLLALATEKEELFLPPNEIISCSASVSQEYVLRVRFIPPEHVIGRLASSSLHSTMFNYLFLQMRSDFLNDHIDYDRETSIKQEHLLGLGVIDMVRYSKERQTDLRRLDPQDFIPVSAREKFKFVWNRKRLQINFKPHLDKEYERYRNDNAVNIKLTYMKSILGYTENNYGMETFVVPSVCNGTGDTRIVVKPYDRMFPGISVYENDDKFHFHSTITDVMDISLPEQPSGVVHINRRTGVPKVVQFDVRQKAISFVSLVDGYYRLQENYHHHLCKDIVSPLLAQLRVLRCHGPVSKEWAERRLLDRHTRDSSFNFLLRQSEKEFGGFTLVFLASPTSRKPLFLQIKQNDKEHYQLQDKEGMEPCFMSMVELIDHYRRAGQDGSSTIALNKCVFPVDPLDSKIYLCRADAKSVEDGFSLSHQQRTPVSLVSMVQWHKMLDCGAFTEVWSGSLEKRNDEGITTDVALKRLKQNSSVPQEYFTQGLNQVVFWNHPTIVTVLAVCLARPICLVLEKADYGSLDKYLQKNKSQLRVSHLTLAAEQLAQAMFYLEGRNAIHGNIRCRNVLVFQHEPKGRFVVKLGDGGLVHYYCKLPFKHPINIERLPWIAPECYERLHSQSVDSDIYSFGVCLWEIFSYGARPYATLSPEELMQRVKQSEVLPKPDSCRENMYSIMKSCWDLASEVRHRPREIIRNIRSLLVQEDVSNEYNDPEWLDRQQIPRLQKGNHFSSQFSPLPDDQLLSAGLSSSAAIAENEANNKRLLQVQSAGIDTANVEILHGSITSFRPNNSCQPPGTEQSCSGATTDSGTPLLSPGSLNVSSEILLPCGSGLVRSEGDGSATSSDATLMTDLESTGSTFVGSPSNMFASINCGQMSAIQRRPLPQPPQSDVTGHELQYWDVMCDQSKTLGQGHYGEVIKGHYTNESGHVQDVAIKRLKKTMTAKYASEFEKEFRIMVRLEHSNIVRIIGRCHEPNGCMLLVMEFVSNGCLRDYLKRSENSQLTANELLRFGRETVEGMVYLSSQKIVHRDLATRNVLVTVDCHMKISDFGLSRALASERDYYKCTDDRTDLPAPWCAPEALMYHKFSEASDVWSYGVTLWEIFSFGQAPRLGEINELSRLIHQGHRLARPKSCPKPVYDLMLYKCWQYYAVERWTFKMILDELQRLEKQ